MARRVALALLCFAVVGGLFILGARFVRQRRQANEVAPPTSHQTSQGSPSPGATSSAPAVSTGALAKITDTEKPRLMTSEEALLQAGTPEADKLWKEFRRTAEFAEKVKAIPKLIAAAERRGDLAQEEIDRLIVMMHHWDWGWRAEAAMLSMLATSESTRRQLVPHILPLLEDPHPRVRFDACRSLGKIGDREAIPLLEPRTTDPERKVRDAAAEAIQSLQKLPPKP